MAQLAVSILAGVALLLAAGCPVRASGSKVAVLPLLSGITISGRTVTSGACTVISGAGR